MTDKVLQLVIGELQSKYVIPEFSADSRMRGLLSNARFEKKHNVYAERGGVYRHDTPERN